MSRRVTALRRGDVARIGRRFVTVHRIDQTVTGTRVFGKDAHGEPVVRVFGPGSRVRLATPLPRKVTA